jgi:exopolysaccharide biosynthesis protein
MGLFNSGKYANVIAVDGGSTSRDERQSKVGFVMKSGVIYKNQDSAVPFVPWDWIKSDP